VVSGGGQVEDEPSQYPLVNEMQDRFRQQAQEVLALMVILFL
jgi:hypothetical protein